MKLTKQVKKIRGDWALFGLTLHMYVGARLPKKTASFLLYFHFPLFFLSRFWVFRTRGVQKQGKKLTNKPLSTGPWRNSLSA
jgi:hypothetical protein